MPVVGSTRLLICPVVVESGDGSGVCVHSIINEEKLAVFRRDGFILLGGDDHLFLFHRMQLRFGDREGNINRLDLVDGHEGHTWANDVAPFDVEISGSPIDW